MNISIRGVMVGVVLLGSLNVTPPAAAEPIVITGGFVGMLNGYDLPGFDLTGVNSEFTGIMPIGGVVCCAFSRGETVTLHAGFPLSSLAFEPTKQVVDGTTYHSFVSGSLTITSVPFVAPSPNGSAPFSFSTPFTMIGQISGYANFGGSDNPPLFTVPLVGAGTATVSGNTRSSAPTYIGQSLAFQFEAATPSPTPEPASMLLVGSGVAALATVKRRRDKRAERRQAITEAILPLPDQS
jgi:hypothetical protein